MKNVICPTCGAKLSVQDSEVSVQCHFCSSILSVAGQSTPPPSYQAPAAPQMPPEQGYHAPREEVPPSIPSPNPYSYQSTQNGNPSSLPPLRKNGLGLPAVLFIILFAVVLIVILLNLFNVFGFMRDARERQEEMIEEAEQRQEEIRREAERAKEEMLEQQYGAKT